jgi:hypothetical protein
VGLPVAIDEFASYMATQFYQNCKLAQTGPEIKGKGNPPAPLPQILRTNRKAFQPRTTRTLISKSLYTYFAVNDSAPCFHDADG